MKCYFFLHYQKKIIHFFSPELVETETNIKFAQAHTMEKHHYLHLSFTVQHLWDHLLTYLSGVENVECTMMVLISSYETQGIQQVLMKGIDSKCICNWPFWHNK
jgi:hypothetical protein